MEEDFPCTQALTSGLSDDDSEKEENKSKHVGILKVQQHSEKDSILTTEFPICVGRVVIGRHADCDISMPWSSAVSKEHATLEADEDSCFVTDCGSSNKTRLGKVKLRPDVKYGLRDGDEITFGDVKCTYHQISEKAAETIGGSKNVLAADTPEQIHVKAMSLSVLNDSSLVVPESQPTLTDTPTLSLKKVVTKNATASNEAVRPFQLDDSVNDEQGDCTAVENCEITEMNVSHVTESDADYHTDSDTDLDDTKVGDEDVNDIYNADTEVEDIAEKKKDATVDKNVCDEPGNDSKVKGDKIAYVEEMNSDDEDEMLLITDLAVQQSQLFAVFKSSPNQDQSRVSPDPVISEHSGTKNPQPVVDTMSDPDEDAFGNVCTEDFTSPKKAPVFEDTLGLLETQAVVRSHEVEEDCISDVDSLSEMQTQAFPSCLVSPTDCDFENNDQDSFLEKMPLVGDSMTHEKTGDSLSDVPSKKDFEASPNVEKVLREGDNVAEDEDIILSPEETAHSSRSTIDEDLDLVKQDISVGKKNPLEIVDAAEKSDDTERDEGTSCRKVSTPSLSDGEADKISVPVETQFENREENTKGQDSTDDLDDDETLPISFGDGVSSKERNSGFSLNTSSGFKFAENYSSSDDTQPMKDVQPSISHTPTLASDNTPLLRRTSDVVVDLQMYSSLHATSDVSLKSESPGGIDEESTQVYSIDEIGDPSCSPSPGTTKDMDNAPLSSVSGCRSEEVPQLEDKDEKGSKDSVVTEVEDDQCHKTAISKLEEESVNKDKSVEDCVTSTASIMKDDKSKISNQKVSDVLRDVDSVKQDEGNDDQEIITSDSMMCREDQDHGCDLPEVSSGKDNSSNEFKASKLTDIPISACGEKSDCVTEDIVPQTDISEKLSLGDKPSITLHENQNLVKDESDICSVKDVPASTDKIAEQVCDDLPTSEGCQNVTSLTKEAKDQRELTMQKSKIEHTLLETSKHLMVVPEHNPDDRIQLECSQTSSLPANKRSLDESTSLKVVDKKSSTSLKASGNMLENLKKSPVYVKIVPVKLPPLTTPGDLKEVVEETKSKSTKNSSFVKNNKSLDSHKENVLTKSPAITPTRSSRRSTRKDYASLARGAVLEDEEDSAGTVDENAGSSKSSKRRKKKSDESILHQKKDVTKDSCDAVLEDIPKGSSNPIVLLSDESIKVFHPDNDNEVASEDSAADQDNAEVENQKLIDESTNLRRSHRKTAGQKKQFPEEDLPVRRTPRKKNAVPDIYDFEDSSEITVNLRNDVSPKVTACNEKDRNQLPTTSKKVAKAPKCSAAKLDLSKSLTSKKTSGKRLDLTQKNDEVMSPTKKTRRRKNSTSSMSSGSSRQTKILKPALEKSHKHPQTESEMETPGTSSQSRPVRNRRNKQNIASTLPNESKSSIKSKGNGNGGKDSIDEGDGEGSSDTGLRKRKISTSTSSSDKKLKSEETSSQPIISRSRPRRAAVKPKVMFTGIVDNVAETIVTNLGGRMATDILDCTHLVTDKIRRTIKFLCAVAKGLHILKLDWLHMSNEHKRFLPEDDFLLTDERLSPNEESLQKKYKFKLADTLHQARESENLLFHNMRFFVTKNVTPEPNQMKQILQSAGANVLTKMPNFRRGDISNVVIIATEEDRGSLSNAITAGCKIVSNEFVLTGLLRHQIDFQSFSLFDTCTEEISEPTAAQASSQRRRTRKK